MMKRIIAIRNVSFEDLGSFYGAFEQAGYRVHYLEAEEDLILSPITLAADLVVFLGGTMCANEEDGLPFIKDEIKLINERIKAEKPILGICLGAQLIAKALGANVYPAEKKEIGYRPITLTEEGKQTSLKHLEHSHALHWHGDTFDLPQGAVLLASTKLCKNQAFSFGKNVMALQFHPEVTRENFDEWCAIYEDEIEATPKLNLKKLQEQSDLHADKLEQCGRWFILDWLKEIGL